MNSIPASQLVSVVPSVLGAGGNPLSMNAVFITQDASVPIGTVKAFSALDDVQDWFGDNSTEAALAAVYFAGFAGATSLPGTLYFTQYNAAAVAAYLRSGSFEAVTLAALQALSGALNVTVNGDPVVSANINLAGAVSFSNAAALITTGLQTPGGIFSGTGTVVNTSAVLTVNSTVSGALHVGDNVVGVNIPVGATILSFGTYTVLSGVGTVNLSAAATGSVGPEAITVSSTAVCTYDSQRTRFLITSPTTGATSTIGYATGSLAAGLELTLATGAEISPGAAGATPAGLMNTVVGVTQNWATFMTTFEPVLSVKLQFAAWVNGTSPPERYAYVVEDSDVAPTTGAAPASFGPLTAAYNGVMSIWNTGALAPAGTLAAFVCGATASIDFTATQGTLTYAYKGQAGLVPNVTDATIGNNLIANGYNFYGSYATAAQQFQLFQPGLISGAWAFADEYINQIYLNSQFQLALLSYLANVKKVPYNAAGYASIRAALKAPINQGLLNGTIEAGVDLSPAQAQAVNTAAGVAIDTTLGRVGWYLQILPASAQTRGNRTSPPMTFWYTSGGAIQKLNLASINVQ